MSGPRPSLGQGGTGPSRPAGDGSRGPSLDGDRRSLDGGRSLRGTDYALALSSVQEGDVQPMPGFVLPHDESRASLWVTVRATMSALSHTEGSAVVAQAYEIGVRSLPFLCLVLAFVGGIIVYQAGIQAMRIVPDTSGIGPGYIELLVRDLAANLTGLMLATRVGASIAAELGSMKVTDQLDAMRLCQTDPVAHLVAPRFLACVLVTPILTIIAGACALASGTLVGALAFDIRPQNFLDPRFVTISAMVSGFLKSLAFGLAIPLVSAHAGLYTRVGSQGVGDATTGAVVGSSVAVIVLGFFIGAVLHVALGGA